MDMTKPCHRNCVQGSLNPLTPCHDRSIDQSKGAVRVAFDISPPSSMGGGGSGVLASFITETSPELFYLTDDERKRRVLESFARRVVVDSG